MFVNDYAGVAVEIARNDRLFLIRHLECIMQNQYWNLVLII